MSSKRLAFATVLLAGTIIFVIGRAPRHTTPVPSNQPCTFALLSPLHFDGDLITGSAWRMPDGLLVTLLRDIPGARSRRETLVRVTTNAIDVTEPAPLASATGVPTTTFVWGTQADTWHFVYYERDEGGLVVGARLGQEPTREWLLPREPTTTSIAPVAMARYRDDPSFVVAGRGGLHLFGGSVEGPTSRGIVRLYATDDASGPVALDAVDDASLVETAADGSNDEHIAYTFVASGRLYAAAFAVHIKPGVNGLISVAPRSNENTTTVALGASVRGAAIALHDEVVHVVWGERGHLEHATLSLGGDILQPATDLGASSDGARPTLQLAGKMTRLAWRDAAHVWYGEGPTVEVAARHAGALPDTGGAQGPWLAPVEKGTLVAWVSSTNELRRAVVTCRD